MDWRAIQFDWNRARAFLVASEEGSFSAAARALGTTQPTIGRQVAALEEELGVLLFERAGTQLEPTASGLDLIEHVRRMGEAAAGVSLAATGQATSIAGQVCITASEVISTYLLPPLLAPLRIEYPGIELEIVAANDARDLNRREADIAIRNFRPDQPDLISRKLGTRMGYLYATPDYIKRVGPLNTPADLVRAEFFAFDRSDIMIKGMKRFEVETKREQYPIVSANHLVQWSMCKQGAGLCFMMSEVGDPEPAVQRVVPQVAYPVPMWLVCHRELRTSRRIRLVFERLAEGLSINGE